jgi:cellobiose phosphorylase
VTASKATGVARMLKEYLRFANGKSNREVLNRVAVYLEEYAMALDEPKRRINR